MLCGEKEWGRFGSDFQCFRDVGKSSDFLYLVQLSDGNCLLSCVWVSITSAPCKPITLFCQTFHTCCSSCRKRLFVLCLEIWSVSLFLTKCFMRVRRSWLRVPREMVGATSMELFQARLDRTLSNLGWWKMSLQGVGLNEPSVSPHPEFSLLWGVGSSPALQKWMHPLLCCVFLSLADSKLHGGLQCMVKPDLCPLGTIAELSLSWCLGSKGCAHDTGHGRGGLEHNLNSNIED